MVDFGNNMADPLFVRGAHRHDPRHPSRQGILVSATLYRPPHELQGERQASQCCLHDVRYALETVIEEGRFFLSLALKKTRYETAVLFAPDPTLAYLFLGSFLYSLFHSSLFYRSACRCDGLCSVSSLCLSAFSPPRAPRGLILRVPQARVRVF